MYSGYRLELLIHEPVTYGMNVPLRHLRAVFFVAAAVSLLMSGSLAVRNLNALIGDGKAAIHTVETMQELEKTLSSLIDAETGQRGYLLTGRDTYLEPYRKVTENNGITAHIQILRHLTAKEPAQQRHLDVLESLITAKLREVQKTIDLRRHHGLSQALTLVRSDIGKRTMDKSRALIREMEDDEDASLDLRTNEHDTAAQRAIRSFITGICLSIGILLISGGLLQREVTQRRHAEQAVQQLNGELEIRVQQRTEKLELAQQQIIKHTNELERTHTEMLERLAHAGEFRDDETGQHTLRVGNIAALVAQGQGFSADEVRRIQEAARLHDVGKIGISDTILLKPGKLTEEEFATMKTHTTIGAALFEDGHSELVQIAQRIAASHHERWDGTGYPQGLRGEEIPHEARILAVADVFDALTHERPYKKAWPVSEAVAEIERQSGRHFDPEIVKTFLQLAHDALI